MNDEPWGTDPWLTQEWPWTLHLEVPKIDVSEEVLQIVRSIVDDCGEGNMTDRI